MKITSITRGRSHKINPGNYESIEISSHVTAELDDNDDPVEVGVELETLLDSVLDKPVERILLLAKDHPKIEESHTWDFYEYE